QGTPLLIHEAAFKAFVVTNTLAFFFSVSALTIHFGILDNLLSRFKFYRDQVIGGTQYVSGILCYATLAMVIAFSTGEEEESLRWQLDGEDDGDDTRGGVGAR
ncbi:hypothetical protein Goshw_021902, partial [Gossypium schwendimanii]|nr:hypothetical protein [Gossypium schwendimanii]